MKCAVIVKRPTKPVHLFDTYGKGILHAHWHALGARRR